MYIVISKNTNIELPNPISKFFNDELEQSIWNLLK